MSHADALPVFTPTARVWLCALSIVVAACAAGGIAVDTFSDDITATIATNVANALAVAIGVGFYDACLQNHVVVSEPMFRLLRALCYAAVAMLIPTWHVLVREWMDCNALEDQVIRDANDCFTRNQNTGYDINACVSVDSTKTVMSEYCLHVLYRSRSTANLTYAGIGILLCVQSLGVIAIAVVVHQITRASSMVGKSASRLLMLASRAHLPERKDVHDLELSAISDILLDFQGTAGALADAEKSK